MAPIYPGEEINQVAELGTRGNLFKSGIEEERNKREWLRQVSSLAAGLIHQVL